MPSTPASRRISSLTAHAYAVPVVRELPAQAKADVCTW
jgi:hypothetical protein